MQSRRDQVQAYRFAQVRMQSALVTGETDGLDVPLRRAGVSTFAGVMIAVLLLAVAGVIGLIRPGGKTGWADGGVLVVEKETGARYVYDSNDRALHPVLNYTSARLLLNEPEISVRRFSANSLAGVARGRALGIAGLPDSLPDDDHLVSGPWLTCAGRDSSSGPQSITVSGGYRPTGRAVGADEAVLVQVTSGDLYVLWNNTRLKVIDMDVTGAAFDWSRSDAVTVPDAWVNAIPAGPDLVAPHLSGIGRKVPYAALDGTAIFLGQIFKVDAQAGQPDRYYVAVDDGLARISTFVAQLMLADPYQRAAYYNGDQSPVPFSTSTETIARIPSSRVVAPGGFPADRPDLIRAGSLPDGASSAVCAAYDDPSGASTASRIYLGGRGPGSWQPPREEAGTGGVNVVVPPGEGALIRPLAHAGQDGGSTFLLTDGGVKYPVPSAKTKEVLGYKDAGRAPVPAGVAALIPTGPALSEEAAYRAGASVISPSAQASAAVS
ncbi:type VII secretion protein EccB [Spongisporangium articulatum]|uniref:Type VII secretion protein EccB n=1 Tax=Spongisporangium articulatum TaxID=3362603 RepID=A0ABW8ATY9_9ACTN